MRESPSTHGKLCLWSWQGRPSMKPREMITRCERSVTQGRRNLLVIKEGNDRDTHIFLRDTVMAFSDRFLSEFRQFTRPPYSSVHMSSFGRRGRDSAGSFRCGISFPACFGSSRMTPVRTGLAVRAGSCSEGVDNQSALAGIQMNSGSRRRRFEDRSNRLLAMVLGQW
jgi:hypothetical protein